MFLHALWEQQPTMEYVKHVKQDAMLVSTQFHSKKLFVLIALSLELTSKEFVLIAVPLDSSMLLVLNHV